MMRTQFSLESRKLTLLAAPLKDMRPCDGLKLKPPLNAAGIDTEPPGDINYKLLLIRM